MGLHVFSEGAKIRSLTSRHKGCMMVTEQFEGSPLTPTMIERIQAAVMAVATGGSGWGQVVIVIEKGEPKRIQQTVDEWLLRRNA